MYVQRVHEFEGGKVFCAHLKSQLETCVYA